MFYCDHLEQELYIIESSCLELSAAGGGGLELDIGSSSDLLAFFSYTTACADILFFYFQVISFSSDGNRSKQTYLGATLSDDTHAT